MSGIHTKHNSVSKDQRGMASILITMITIIVVSLIVLGFAMISRREQSNTLDQQLSTQAFYAAESGVNDARNVIQNAVNHGHAVPSKSSCSDPGSDSSYPYPTSAETQLVGQNVSYTCLLVNPVETTLVYDGVDTNPRIVPINTVGGATIDNLTIKWTASKDTSDPLSGCPTSATNQFSSTSNWTCGYGILRTDLVPTQGTLDRGSLQSSELTGFFTPVSSGGSGNITYGSPTEDVANVLAANCNTTNCTVRVSGLPDLTNLALRISSIYQAAGAVTIEAFHGTTPVPITGTQITVDATGKASGVLRRIQVRIPANGSSNLTPGAALQSNGGVCKRFFAGPGYLNFPGDVKSPDSSNSLCTISGIQP